MMNRIKYLLVLLPSVFILFVPSLAAADSTSQVIAQCDPSSPSYNPALKDSPTCKDVSNGDTSNPLVHLINVAATVVALITGIAAVVMIIIGGLSYVSSSGNAEQAVRARQRILYSVVGLIVVAMASVITVFVTNNVLH